MEKKGTVYFFTGLAGAGKTTIGGLFYQRLKECSPEAIFLDGDQTRLAAGDSSADGTVLFEERYTTEARKRGAFDTFRYVRNLSDQGKDVVICSIAMYTEVRSWNRENGTECCFCLPELCFPAPVIMKGRVCRELPMGWNW